MQLLVPAPVFPASSDGIQIFVRVLESPKFWCPCEDCHNGRLGPRTLVLRLPSLDVPVALLQHLIETRVHVPPHHQRLTFGGIPLSNLRRYISSYGVSPESTIQVLPRLRGGFVDPISLTLVCLLAFNTFVGIYNLFPHNWRLKMWYHHRTVLAAQLQGTGGHGPAWYNIVRLTSAKARLRSASSHYLMDNTTWYVLKNGDEVSIELPALPRSFPSPITSEIHIKAMSLSEFFIYCSDQATLVDFMDWITTPLVPIPSHLLAAPLRMVAVPPAAPASRSPPSCSLPSGFSLPLCSRSRRSATSSLFSPAPPEKSTKSVPTPSYASSSSSTTTTTTTSSSKFHVSPSLFPAVRRRQRGEGILSEQELEPLFSN